MNPHEPVTVLRYADRSVHALCSDVFKSGNYMFVWNGIGAGHVVTGPVDEGIIWIRGHHAPDSEAVAALRVAYALGRAS